MSRKKQQVEVKRVDCTVTRSWHQTAPTAYDAMMLYDRLVADLAKGARICITTKTRSED